MKKFLIAQDQNWKNLNSEMTTDMLCALGKLIHLSVLKVLVLLCVYVGMFVCFNCFVEV